MIDHTSCDHDRTRRDREQCRDKRAELVDRLRLLSQQQRDLVEVILDLADVDTADAPARDLLDLANVQGTIRQGVDAVTVIAQPDSNATVGDLLDALGQLGRSRPVMLVTGDDTTWLRAVRDARTGIVELHAPGVTA